LRLKNLFTVKILKFAAKLAITAIALYFVFTKIDFTQITQNIVRINLLWFVTSLIAFNISKLFSAFRLSQLVQALGIHLSINYNIKLNYVGMFYNLFLPGSVGGDGYKVYLLHQRYKANLKDLISATLLDRISGVVFLAFITGFFLYYSSYQPPFPYYHTLIIAGTILILPVYYVGYRLVFKKFLPKFTVTTLQSIVVQVLQVVCASCLLLSLDVQGHFIDYLTLFMISSVVSVLPITVGGVGIREVVFLYGFQYLQIDRASAISFTLLFFAITALSSLIGLFFTFGLDKPTETVLAPNINEG
jgi:hypothetical protein